MCKQQQRLNSERLFIQRKMLDDYVAIVQAVSPDAVDFLNKLG